MKKYLLNKNYLLFFSFITFLNSQSLVDDLMDNYDIEVEKFERKIASINKSISYENYIKDKALIYIEENPLELRKLYNELSSPDYNWNPSPLKYVIFDNSIVGKECSASSIFTNEECSNFESNRFGIGSKKIKVFINFNKLNICNIFNKSETINKLLIDNYHNKINLRTSSDYSISFNNNDLCVKYKLDSSLIKDSITLSRTPVNRILTGNISQISDLPDLQKNNSILVNDKDSNLLFVSWMDFSTSEGYKNISNIWQYKNAPNDRPVGRLLFNGNEAMSNPGVFEKDIPFQKEYFYIFEKEHKDYIFDASSNSYVEGLNNFLNYKTYNYSPQPDISTSPEIGYYPLCNNINSREFCIISSSSVKNILNTNLLVKRENSLGTCKFVNSPYKGGLFQLFGYSPSSDFYISDFNGYSNTCADISKINNGINTFEDSCLSDFETKHRVVIKFKNTNNSIDNFTIRLKKEF